MRLTWVLTVSFETTSRSAISALDSPSATSRSTSPGAGFAVQQTVPRGDAARRLMLPCYPRAGRSVSAIRRSFVLSDSLEMTSKAANPGRPERTRARR